MSSSASVEDSWSVGGPARAALVRTLAIAGSSAAIEVVLVVGAVGSLLPVSGAPGGGGAMECSLRADERQAQAARNV